MTSRSEGPYLRSGRLVTCLNVAVLALTPSLAAVSSSPPSFAASMSRVCAIGTARANAVGQVSSVEDLVRLGPHLIAIDQWELEEIVKLGAPPAPIAKYVSQFVAMQRRIDSLGSEAFSAARSGDAVTAERLSQRSSALTRTQDFDARMIGAARCLSSMGAR